MVPTGRLMVSQGENNMRGKFLPALFIIINVFSSACGDDPNSQNQNNQNNPNPTVIKEDPPVDVDGGTPLPLPLPPPKYTPTPYVYSENPFTKDGKAAIDYCKPNLGGDWGWWCLIRGPYQARNSSKMDLTIYQVRTDICPSGMAVGALFSGYFTPPTACLITSDSPEVRLDSGAMHYTGRFHFCHCNLLALGRGDASRQQCYAFQAKNGDQEDEHTCDEATGGTYLILTSGMSTFRYDRLDPQGSP